MLRFIPNIITIFRVFLVAPFVYFFVYENFVAAFAVFFLAGFSDFIDGLLARRFHWTTRFGAYMDPLADKLLVIAAFLLLVQRGVLPLWLCLLVIVRDVIIISGVSIAIRICGDVTVKPNFISKVNTGIQVLLIILLLFNLAFTAVPNLVISALIVTLTVTSIVSVGAYIIEGTQLVLSHKKLQPPE